MHTLLKAFDGFRLHLASKLARSIDNILLNEGTWVILWVELRNIANHMLPPSE